MQQMVHYQFIWTDLYCLVKDHEKIYTHFSSVHEEPIKWNFFL